MDGNDVVWMGLQVDAPGEQIIMDPVTDPIGMIVSGGGGLGGGAIGGYLLSRVLSNGKGNDSADIKNELAGIGHKLDNTNELLNELLRSQARLEGILANK